jgi:polar amino acid transport system substrate-binding protein
MRDCHLDCAYNCQQRIPLDVRIWLLAFCLLAGTAGAAETLRVVSPDYWCPYSCKLGSKPEGFGIDILRAIFEPEGYRLDYSNANYSRAMLQVREGKADAIPDMVQSEAADFIYPQEPMAQIRYCIYANQQSDWRYRSTADLLERQLLVVQGYDYGEPFSSWLSAHPQQVKHLSGNDVTQRLSQMIMLHRADALIEDESVMDSLLSQQAALKLRKAGCGPAIYAYLGLSPKLANAAQLSQLFDQGMRRLRQSAELETIMQRYGLHDWAASQPTASTPAP